MDTATAATTAPGRGWLVPWSPLGGPVYIIGVVVIFLRLPATKPASSPPKPSTVSPATRPSRSW